MKTRVALIVAALLLIIILGLVVAKVTHLSETFAFSDEGCDSTLSEDLAYEGPQEGALGFIWDDDGAFILEAYIWTHVEGARLTGGYRLEGSQLHFLYETKITSAATIMTCPHRVVYRIPNLKLGNYVISIHPKDEPDTALALSFDPCAVEDIEPYGPPYEGILGYTWEQNVLVVEAFVKQPFCGPAVVTADYRVAGDELLLLYGIGGLQTDCMCVHRLVYRIANLERREYRILIREIRTYVTEHNAETS